MPFSLSASVLAAALLCSCPVVTAPFDGATSILLQGVLGADAVLEEHSETSSRADLDNTVSGCPSSNTSLTGQGDISSTVSSRVHSRISSSTRPVVTTNEICALLDLPPKTIVGSWINHFHNEHKPRTIDGVFKEGKKPSSIKTIPHGGLSSTFRGG